MIIAIKDFSGFYDKNDMIFVRACQFKKIIVWRCIIQIQICNFAFIN